jgi:hypothetical protein
VVGGEGGDGVEEVGDFEEVEHFILCAINGEYNTYVPHLE